MKDVLDEKVVCVPGRRRKHDYHGDNPVLEEACGRGLEGLIACPEFGEGEDALAAEFLHNYTATTLASIPVNPPPRKKEKTYFSPAKISHSAHSQTHLVPQKQT